MFTGSIHAVINVYFTLLKIYVSFENAPFGITGGYAPAEVFLEKGCSQMLTCLDVQLRDLCCKQSLW
jgi:hypothetical protein